METADDFLHARYRENHIQGVIALKTIPETNNHRNKQKQKWKI